MRAAVFEELGKPLALVEIADPASEAGELVLRVRSAPRGRSISALSRSSLPTEGWRCGDRACARCNARWRHRGV